MKKENVNINFCMAEICIDCRLSNIALTDAQIRDLFSCQSFVIDWQETKCAVLIENFSINLFSINNMFEQPERMSNAQAVYLISKSDKGSLCDITRIK